MREFQPIFLIGAARSGTKILRDVIAQHPDVDKVPFDINYVWRLGNEDVLHDEIPLIKLTPKIRERIVKNIDRFNTSAPFLIEKTVSNCLRIPFVVGVFPRAKFIHLIRQGEDVIESAYRQWLAPPDLYYIFRKGMTFPILDAFGYGFSYVRKTIARVLPSSKQTPSIWGLHYRGIEKDLKEKELLEVCAIQWLRCLEKATLDLCEQETGRVFLLHYENFVEDPEHHLRYIANFIGIDPSPYASAGIRDLVQISNVGKGGKNLTSQQQALIHPYVQHGQKLLESPVIAQKSATT